MYWFIRYLVNYSLQEKTKYLKKINKLQLKH